MKYASDFRSIARDALKGRWGIAVLAGLIATLLGAVSSGGPEVTLNMGDTGTSLNLEFANQQIFSTADGWMPKLNAFLIGGAMYIILVAIVMAVVFFVLGSVISLGYSRFNLDLVDRRKDPELGTTKVTNFTYTPIFTVKDTESPDGFRRVVRIEQAMTAYENNYVDKVSTAAYSNMDKALRRIYERVTGEKFPEETTPTETTVPAT